MTISTDTQPAQNRPQRTVLCTAVVKGDVIIGADGTGRITVLEVYMPVDEVPYFETNFGYLEPMGDTCVLAADSEKVFAFTADSITDEQLRQVTELYRTVPDQVIVHFDRSSVIEAIQEFEDGIYEPGISPIDDDARDGLASTVLSSSPWLSLDNMLFQKAASLIEDEVSRAVEVWLVEAKESDEMMVIDRQIRDEGR